MSNRANRVARFLLPVFVIALLSGCINSPGGIAPSNIPLGGREYRVVGPVATSSSSIRLFMILPVSSPNSIRAAMDAAMRQRSADALIDITVERYTQYWFLFSRHVTSVRGTAIQFDDWERRRDRRP
jgi:hypothetical protein